MLEEPPGALQPQEGAHAGPSAEAVVGAGGGPGKRPRLEAEVEAEAAAEAHRALLSECHRYVALSELRKAFGKLWKTSWGRAAPAEAFNAWLLEALNGPGEQPAWPPLPGGSETQEAPPAASRAVQTWALLHVPYDWPQTQDRQAALEHLAAYTSALQRPPQPVRWAAVPEESVAAALDSAGLGAAQLRGLGAEALRSAARKALRPLAEEAVEAQVRYFSVEARSLCGSVRERWAERERQSLEEAAPPAEGRLVVALEELLEAKTRLSLQGPLPEGLEGKLPRRFEIHAACAERLRRRFAGGRGGFGPACWVLLARYQALFGPHDEGAGWHMALTPQVMQSLAQEFGVAHELFASPLNCALPGYCSVFPDVDGSFGSSGSFSLFCRGAMVRQGGSFECNPPFEEHLMRLAVRALLEALAVCKKPLSIALIIPDWPESEALAAAVGSPHRRAELRVSGERHAYLNGRQHSCQAKYRVLQQSEGRGSVIVFLQNEDGAARWPVTSDGLERHRSAWGPV